MPDDTLKAAEDAARNVADAVQSVRQRLNQRIEWEKQRARGGVTTATPPNVMNEVTYLVARVRDGERAIIARRDAEHAALRAAAQEVMKSFEAYVALGPDAKPEAEWDEYDYMMIPAWRRFKAALDATPWEPSEEMVERAAVAMFERDQNGSVDDYPNTWWYARDAWMGSARDALKAAFNPQPADQPASE